ncbi:MAG TPA: hypothetical protein VGW75_12545 [Solirubrobacteraceae bacterium]|nr:hypothetical protein [Solirubrobacteraceae bacterium]
MRRTIIALVTLALCVAGGFATATVLGAGADGSPAPKPAGGLDLGAKPGSDSVESRQADPAGRGPDWGVVVFTARNGHACAAAGPIAGGRVGARRRDGTIAPYPIDEGASCVDLDAVPAGAQVTMGTGAGARTVVHGVAGPDVASVTLTTPQGARDLRIGPRGSFLAVLDAADAALGDVKLSARLHSGASRQLLG